MFKFLSIILLNALMIGKVFAASDLGLRSAESRLVMMTLHRQCSASFVKGLQRPDSVSLCTAAHCLPSRSTAIQAYFGAEPAFAIPASSFESSQSRTADFACAEVDRSYASFARSLAQEQPAVGDSLRVIGQPASQAADVECTYSGYYFTADDGFVPGLLHVRNVVRCPSAGLPADLHGISGGSVTDKQNGFIGTVVVSRKKDSAGNFFLEYMVRNVVQVVLSMVAYVAIIAPFSRWREFRADAGGAHLAGKNRMIAALQALQDTFRLPQGDVAPDRALAAMKISSPTPASLFSTHPSLDDRIAALQSQIEQAEIKRDIVVSNYPAYRETGASIRRQVDGIAQSSKQLALTLRRFDYTFDSNELSDAIRQTYELTDEAQRIGRRLVRYRQLVDSGVPENADTTAVEPPASLLPLP